MWKKIKDMFEKIKDKIKNNAYVIVLNEVWPDFESKVKRYGLVKFAITWGLISYVFETYNSQIMFWYDDNIIPILEQIETNILLCTITLFLIFVAFYDIIKKLYVRYQFNKYLILALYFIKIRIY